MSQPGFPTDSLARLPDEPADWFTKPFVRFIRVESLAGAALLFSAVLALILSNSILAPEFSAVWNMQAAVGFGEFEVSRSVKLWINDGLMTLFFFVVALELKRELVLGELRKLRLAALPFAAALGGMFVPVAGFLLVVGDSPGATGWGTVMSTDTAFVIGCLAVLGRRVPPSLRLFLLSLAIFDDIGAILVVAIAYGDELNWFAFGWAAAFTCIVAVASRLGVRSLAVYTGLGLGMWVAFDASGIHATLAGVILGLMTPANSWVSGKRLHAILDRVISRPPHNEPGEDRRARRDLHRAGVATREAVSPIERLELALHPWVAFVIMPLFALANAGVPIASTSYDGTIAAAILVAFVAGKPLGVILFSALAVKLGIALRPAGLAWPIVAAGSLLTGIGFTMALFIAELAFSPALLNSVKLGILGASITSAVGGFVALAWLTPRQRFDPVAPSAPSSH